jgi:hypothetical protein
MTRTPTLPPDDRSMWRRLVGRAHPDAGGDHGLFIWAVAVRDAVCSGDLGPEARASASSFAPAGDSWYSRPCTLRPVRGLCRPDHPGPGDGRGGRWRPRSPPGDAHRLQSACAPRTRTGARCQLQETGCSESHGRHDDVRALAVVPGGGINPALRSPRRAHPRAA